MATATHSPDPAYGTLGTAQVMRVGFGAMQLEKAPDPVAVLRRAVDLGVDHIDTAQFYGAGRVNDSIRTALHPYPDALRIVTKVGAEHVAATGLVAAQRPEQLRAGVEANLAALGVDRLDVVNLRRMDAGPGIIATGDQVVDLDSQLAELVSLRDAGKIAAIGLSNVDVDQLRRALPAGIVCVQNAYNLLYRTHEDALDLCTAHGIAWVPYFPLGSAFDRMPNVADDETVRAIAAALGRTPAQVGLAWLLAHRAGILLIPGTSSVDHLAENVAVARMVLDPASRTALDAVEQPTARS